MEITGGCLCGAIRYRATADPIAVRVCWCRVCQYLAAGSGSVNVCLPKSAVSVEGQVADYRSTADSGNVMHRRFCPTCGTAMFSESEARPHLLFVRAGTLDDPDLASPQATIWTASAPTWACIDQSIPKVERQPPPIT